MPARALFHTGPRSVEIRDLPTPRPAAFHRRRLAIRSTQVSTIPSRLAATWTHARRRQEAVDLLPELPLADLCTHVFPFAAAADAFRAVDEGTPGLMHAVLDYEGAARRAV